MDTIIVLLPVASCALMTGAMLWTMSRLNGKRKPVEPNMRRELDALRAEIDALRHQLDSSERVAVGAAS